MTITYKDEYRITCNKYSWDLHVRKEVKNDTKKSKKGDLYWADEGFFTSLDTLLNKMSRMEAAKDKSTTTLSDYLILWYDITKNFRDHVVSLKEEGLTEQGK